MCDHLFFLFSAVDEVAREELQSEINRLASECELSADTDASRWSPGARMLLVARMSRRLLPEAGIPLLIEVHDGCCFTSPNSLDNYESVDYESDPTIRFFTRLVAIPGIRPFAAYEIGGNPEDQARLGDPQCRFDSAEQFLARFRTLDADEAIGLGVFGLIYVS